MGYRPSCIRRALTIAVIEIFAASRAMAQSPSQPFQPTPPPPDKFDWIQLTSDEWLKGEFIALYDDAVEFDSEELEELTLDWEDVRVIRTARVVQVRFKAPSDSCRPGWTTTG
jgi:hypothetical protein